MITYQKYSFINLFINITVSISNIILPFRNYLPYTHYLLVAYVK